MSDTKNGGPVNIAKAVKETMDELRGEVSTDPANNSPYPDNVLHQLNEYRAILKTSATWIIRNTNPVIAMSEVAECLAETHAACTSNHPKYLVEWLRDVSAALDAFTTEWQVKKLKAFCEAYRKGETPGNVAILDRS